MRLFVVRNNQPSGCLQILATTKDEKNSAALRAMAIAWTDLAELAEGRASPLDSKNAEAGSGER